jgi:hypothetical protein
MVQIRATKELSGEFAKVYAEGEGLYVESVTSAEKLAADTQTIEWIVNQQRKPIPEKSGAIIETTLHYEETPDGGGRWVCDSIDDVQPLPLWAEGFPTEPDAAEAQVRDAWAAGMQLAVVVSLARQIAIITSELQR